MTEYEDLKETVEKLIGELEANLADPAFKFSAEAVQSTCTSLRGYAAECRAVGTDELNQLAVLLEDTLHEVRERETDWSTPESEWQG